MTLPPSADQRRWFKRFGPPNDTAIRLFCFHYAGGSAVMYRDWSRLMPAEVETISVQLPGRADRFSEPPYDRMAPLVDALIEALGPLLARPFACYGTSMGARVAWALSHELSERGLPMPRKLYVAGSPGPVLDNGEWEWDENPDGLAGYVRDMGGTPAPVLAESELLDQLLPTLRADLTVLSTHGFRPRRPLDVPIRAFAGTDDPEASPERMDRWRVETRAEFALEKVPGGHFFDAAGLRQVVDRVGAELTALAQVT